MVPFRLHNMLHSPHKCTAFPLYGYACVLLAYPSGPDPCRTLYTQMLCWPNWLKLQIKGFRLEQKILLGNLNFRSDHSLLDEVVVFRLPLDACWTCCKAFNRLAGCIEPPSTYGSLKGMRLGRGIFGAMSGVLQMNFSN